jgi:hypothetical protein
VEKRAQFRLTNGAGFEISFPQSISPEVFAVCQVLRRRLAEIESVENNPPIELKTASISGICVLDDDSVVVFRQFGAKA